MTDILSVETSIREGQSVPVAAMITLQGVPVGTSAVQSVAVQVFDRTRSDRTRVGARTTLPVTTVLSTPATQDGYRHNFYHLLTPDLFPGGKQLGGHTYVAEYSVDTDFTGLVLLEVQVAVQPTRSS